MRFLLDANVIIALSKKNPRLRDKIMQYGPWQCAVSSIVLNELYYGIFKSDRVRANLLQVADLPFESLEFTAEDARIAGEIRAALQRIGTPIGPYHTLIAGQALSRDLTLVTRNTHEFARVEGLRVENWET